MGLPMAWHTDMEMMQKPASTKERAMIRRAGGADGQHVFRGVEEGEQGPRGKFKGGQAHQP